MGFLADVGRANVLGQVMQYGQFTQQSRAAQMDMAVKNEQLKKIQRDQEWLFIDEVSAEAEKRGMPNYGKFMGETAMSMGLGKKIETPDGATKLAIQRGDLKSLVESAGKQADLRVKLLHAAYADTVLQKESLDKERGQAKNARDLLAIRDKEAKLEETRKGLRNAILEIAGKNDGEPVVAVMGNDGKPVYVPRSEAAGKEPFHQDPSQSRQYKQFIGSTEDGSSAVIFDARSGDISTKPFPGGVLPGVKGKKSLPAQEAETLGGLKTTHENIKLVRDAFHENLTGAYQGRLNEFLQAYKNNPEFESLRRRVNRLITVAYDLSGKQISEKEIAILQKSILPQVEQMDENFLQSLEELEDWIVRVSKNKQDAFDKAHYDYGRVSIEKSNTPTIKVEPPPMEYFDGEGSIVKDDITGASWQLRGGKPTRIK